MKQHKYLEDNGVKREEIMENICEENGGEPRSHRWKMQRKVYGFDERDTWSMDTAFVQWLLERLLMYKEVNCVDLSFNQFFFENKSITQEKAIEIMIEECKNFLSSDYWSNEHARAWYRLSSLWHVCGLAMWW